VAIPFWSTEDSINPLPSPTGSNLMILVKETVVIPRRSTNVFVKYTTNFMMGVRGYVERIDFGTAPSNSPLSDFDAWAAAWRVGADGQDADGDGVSNYGEYLAGTNTQWDGDHRTSAELA
jgi:hypothetical protein